ncbi:nuclear transport factor 2 family protein [Mycobacterium sp. BMJ-28]
MTTQLPALIAEHLSAVNAFDIDRVMATFADGALVNDNHREIWGTEAITAWVTDEIVGDHITIAVTDAVVLPGVTVVRGRYDGDFDKTNLPDEVILTNYFVVADDKITGLFVIFNH